MINPETIFQKNPFYGEYTFIIGYGKIRSKPENDWIGFCQYRKFWSLKDQNKKYNNLEQLKKDLLKEIPEEYKNFETILGEPLFIINLSYQNF